MGLLYKFLRLSWSDQRLFVETAILLWAVRLGLWLLPFQTERRLLKMLVPATPKKHDEGQGFIDRVGRAVTVMSRMVPMATCLTQALTTQVLVSRHGYEARLCIGVTKNGEKRLEAHAWVESNGRVVIGACADLSQFTVLPPLDIESV